MSNWVLEFEKWAPSIIAICYKVIDALHCSSVRTVMCMCVCIYMYLYINLYIYIYLYLNCKKIQACAETFEMVQFYA